MGLATAYQDRKGFTKLVYQNIFTAAVSPDQGHGHPEDTVRGVEQE